MSMTLESAPHAEQSINIPVTNEGHDAQEVQVTSKVGERIRSGADVVTAIAQRIADRLDARAQAKIARQQGGDQSTMGEVIPIKPEVAEDAEPRESKARRVLADIGTGALGALRATGELAVGVGVVTGDAIKSRIDTTVAASLARKAERVQARDERREERAAERDAALAAKERAEAQKFAESEARRAERAAERAERYEARKAAALARREARHEKWNARKESLKIAVTSTIDAGRQRVEATVDAGRQRVESAIDAGRRGVEATIDAGRRGVEAANKAISERADAVAEALNNRTEALNERADAAIDAFNRGIASAADYGRQKYEDARGAAERLKGRVDDTRAIGAAAIEAARAARSTLRDQRELGQ